MYVGIFSENCLQNFATKVYHSHKKMNEARGCACTDLSLSNEHRGKQRLWTKSFSYMLEFANSKEFILPFVAFVNALVHTKKTYTLKSC